MSASKRVKFVSLAEFRNVLKAAKKSHNELIKSKNYGFPMKAAGVLMSPFLLGIICGVFVLGGACLLIMGVFYPLDVGSKMLGRLIKRWRHKLYQKG